MIYETELDALATGRKRHSNTPSRAPRDQTKASKLNSIKSPKLMKSKKQPKAAQAKPSVKIKDMFPQKNPKGGYSKLETSKLPSK